MYNIKYSESNFVKKISESNFSDDGLTMWGTFSTLCDMSPALLSISFFLKQTKFKEGNTNSYNDFKYIYIITLVHRI